MRARSVTLAACLAATLTAPYRAARAQTPAELAAGRQLFAEALADEEQGRYAEALRKYRRVQALRDTPNIRYRMGASLEHLGKLVQASESYAAAVRLGATGNAAEVEVARVSQARVAALAPRLAHVAFRIDPPGAEGVEISVDGERVEPRVFDDLPVDPGAHAVTATATRARVFRVQLEPTEGAHVDVVIPLGPIETAPAPPAAAAAPPSAAPVEHPHRALGTFVGIAGASLLAGGIVALALRASAISTLNAACPDGACPASRESELSAAKDHAELEGPLGVGLLVAGAAALGAGAYLFTIASPGTNRELTVSPALSGQGVGLHIGARF